MNIYGNCSMYVPRLSFLFIVLSALGCAVGVPSKPESELVRSRDVEVQDNIVVTFSPRELLEEVSGEIEESYNNIVLVDGVQFRDTAFPEGGWRLSKLLSPETCRRVSEQLNVDYLVLIGALDVSEGEEKGFLIPLLWGAVSAEGKAAITALIIDLRTGEVISKISSAATGTSHILYYVIFIAGNEPQVTSEAISSLAREIGSFITELVPKRTARIAVLAMEKFEVSYDLDDWETDKLTYKNKLALEIIKERTNQGERKAQWLLYQVQPNRESMQWLCAEADQGDKKARSELGKLYYYGSDKYREAMDIHVPADLPRACVWFQLAGQAEISERAKSVNSEVKTEPYESPEVERTSKVMSVQEIEDAEKLVLTWQPGNCERDISQHMVSAYVKDPALTRLCAAADLGDFSSRDELGRIYFFGSRGIKRDLIYAYMWYRLAEKVYVAPSLNGKIMQKFCDEMTPEQRSIAAQMLREWEPGKCEEDLLEGTLNKQRFQTPH